MVRFNELLGQATNECVKGEAVYKVPWIEKYRPKKLSQVIHQTEVVKMLENVLETGNLPHLLFYGQPGTGKTSTILAIGMELFGPQKFKERVIELNASDERGINIVRNKIINIAKSSISQGSDEYKCPPYKIIVLDEADAMTTEAQSALRKVMENTSNITRFCFICNYVSKVISPIISRCVKVRFKPINNNSMATKLKYIARREKINIDSQSIDAVVTESNGDMRKGIMFLQNLNYLKKDIVIKDIYSITNTIPRNYLEKIVGICINPQTKIKKISRTVHSIVQEGYPVDNLLKQLNELIVFHPELSDGSKARICMELSNVNRDLIDGADEYLQLLKIFVSIKQLHQLFPIAKS